ncbi:MAG: hypothetical protein ABFS16_03385 [Bacteroidota bacterium]
MKVKIEKPEKLISNLVIRFKRLVYVEFSPRYIRFKGDLCTYRQHLEVFKEGMKEEELKDSWLTKALTLCETASERLKEVRIDEGWKLLHAAERMEVYCCEEKRKATIIQLREEAGKLNEWRKNSILKIIGISDEENKQKDISPQQLEMALQIRDDYYHTLYYTNRLTRGQFNWLFFVLGVLIFLILMFVNSNKLSEMDEMSKLNFTNLYSILLFGLLGATTSSIFRFRNSQSTSRIPEILSNNSITMSRIFVGAGFSVFIFVLLNSEIAKSVELFKFEMNHCYEFFTIAFVSGFSERIALNSIQKIIGKKE